MYLCRFACRQGLSALLLPHTWCGNETAERIRPNLCTYFSHYSIGRLRAPSPPRAQLDALVAVAHAIPALYRAEHPADESRQLGADDFLPIFIYVLVNSGVEGVASLSLVLETLCDPKKMIGEAGRSIGEAERNFSLSRGDGHSTSQVVARRELCMAVQFERSSRLKKCIVH